MEGEQQGFDPVVGVVDEWLAAVFDRADLAAAWPLTHPTLRLAVVQSWLWMEADRVEVAAHDRDALAAAMAGPVQPAHPLWSEFAGWRIVRWREVLPAFVTNCDLRGFVSGTHFVGPLLEAVYVAPADTEVVGGSPVEVQRFLVQHEDDDGWQVIGIGGVLPVPGWPPTETDRWPT